VAALKTAQTDPNADNGAIFLTVGDFQQDHPFLQGVTTWLPDSVVFQIRERKKFGNAANSILS